MTPMAKSLNVTISIGEIRAIRGERDIEVFDSSNFFRPVLCPKVDCVHIGRSEAEGENFRGAGEICSCSERLDEPKIVVGKGGLKVCFFIRFNTFRP
jgi:hypothetical protein